MVTKSYPQEVATILELLPDNGPLPRAVVETWWRFSEYLVNLLEEQALVRRGESFKNQGWAELLVVKVARDGVPLVAFITERTTTDCMRVFLRQLENREVQWREDRFA